MMPAFCNVLFTFGYLLIGVVAMHVRDWRQLILVTNAPFVLAVTLYWALPESLHWLVAKQKTDRVDAWLRWAQRRAGVRVDLAECLNENCGDTVKDTKVKHRTIMDIFRTPILLFHTVLFAFMA